jgi:hypothetical protein
MLRALVVRSLVASPLVAQASPYAGQWKISFSVGALVADPVPG